MFRILQDDVSWTHVLYPQGQHMHTSYMPATRWLIYLVCVYFSYKACGAPLLVHRPSHNVFGIDGISVCALAFGETDHACDCLAELGDFDGSASVELMGGCELANA